jgi:hypothetical protein
MTDLGNTNAEHVWWCRHHETNYSGGGEGVCVVSRSVIPITVCTNFLLVRLPASSQQGDKGPASRWIWYLAPLPRPFRMSPLVQLPHTTSGVDGGAPVSMSAPQGAELARSL